MKMFAILLPGICLLPACRSGPSEQAPTAAKADSVITRERVEQSPGSSTTDRSDAFRIVPGVRIGQTIIGQDVASLQLGQPAFSDAAMGKAWAVYTGKETWLADTARKAELDVYSAYRDSNMHVKEVKELRTTSPAFHVAGSIRVGAEWHMIEQQFPGIQQAFTYTLPASGKKITVYDAVKQGVAFEKLEDENPVCVAIVIHDPGKQLIDSYRYVINEVPWK